jgi:hypothetical protein
MVDFASLNAAAAGNVSRFHTFAQSIETAHLGNLYSKALDGLDYYVVELAAKPALKNAPEWVTDNLAVNTIRTYQGLSIFVGAALTVVSLVSFIIWLHPEGTTPKPPRTDSTDLPPEGKSNPLRSKSLGSEEKDGVDQAANTLRAHSTGSTAKPAASTTTSGNPMTPGADDDVDDKADGGSAATDAAKAKVNSSDDDDGDAPASTNAVAPDADDDLE